jgi:putative hemolysin
MLASALGVPALERLYEQVRGPAIVSDLLRRLDISYAVSEKDRAHIPQRGATVLTVNHPTGILDGAVLIDLLRGIRPDFKLLANGLLAVIPELKDYLIEVDPISKPALKNQAGLRKALDFLQSGGLLVVFPAGSVSHYQLWRGVTDSTWSETIARLIRLAQRRTSGLKIVPAFLRASNSPGFHLLGLISSRLRTAMLIRELLNKRHAKVDLRIGSAIQGERLAEIESDRECMQYLRWRTYLLEGRETYRAQTRWALKRPDATPTVEPIAAPIPGHRVRADIEALPADRLLVSLRRRLP